MRRLIICLGLLLLVEVTWGASRITLTPRLAAKKGSVHSVTVFGGDGANPSQPYESRLFVGYFAQKTPADSLVFVFLSATPADTSVVDALISRFRPKEWTKVRRQEYGSQFASALQSCSFITVPVAMDGTFFVNVDEYRHPCMNTMSLVDVTGVLIERRPIWGE